jgi:hypothetical protein
VVMLLSCWMHASAMIPHDSRTQPKRCPPPLPTARHTFGCCPNAHTMWVAQSTIVCNDPRLAPTELVHWSPASLAHTVHTTPHHLHIHTQPPPQQDLLAPPNATTSWLPECWCSNGMITSFHPASAAYTECATPFSVLPPPPYSPP